MNCVLASHNQFLRPCYYSRQVKPVAGRFQPRDPSSDDFDAYLSDCEKFENMTSLWSIRGKDLTEIQMTNVQRLWRGWEGMIASIQLSLARATPPEVNRDHSADEVSLSNIEIGHGSCSIYCGPGW
jgi:hypothetical protein